jgi:hypothetical protein
MNSFTYVINSINATVPNSANNCYIELAGLPQYRKYHCEVIDFIIDSETLDIANITASYLSLVVDSEMQILDGIMHPKKFDRICNINLNYSCIMSSVKGNIFTVGNFNKHTVNFQLILPNMTRLPALAINIGSTTYWTLTLKMTPIIE